MAEEGFQAGQPDGITAEEMNKIELLIQEEEQAQIERAEAGPFDLDFGSMEQPSGSPIELPIEQDAAEAQAQAEPDVFQLPLDDEYDEYDDMEPIPVQELPAENNEQAINQS